MPSQPARRLAARLILAAAGLLSGAQGLAAGEPDTLDRIRATGEIRLGYRVSSVPFSYVVDGQVMGYSHDLALIAAEAVRQHLGMPELPVRLVPVTPQSRALLISNGRVDMECASTTHSREREAQAGFSSTLFITSIRLLTRKDSGIRDFSDLAGRRVVTTAGTTTEDMLRKLPFADSLTLVSAADHADSFAILRAGRADAFAMDEVQLHNEAVRSGSSDWIITGAAPRAFQAYACMLKKGDTAFKRVIDAALTKAMHNGEAERLYARWFTRPIPPDGINLDMPLPAAMRALYTAPSDTPFP